MKRREEEEVHSEFRSSSSEEGAEQSDDDDDKLKEIAEDVDEDKSSDYNRRMSNNQIKPV